MSMNPPKPYRLSGGDSLVMVDVYSTASGDGTGGFAYDQTTLLASDVPGNLHLMRSGRAFRFGGDKVDNLFDLYISETDTSGALLNISISYRFKIDSDWYTPIGEPVPTGDGRARVAVKRTRA